MGIYNDLHNTYCEMKNQKKSICNEINELMAKREQLEQDIARIEYILSEYEVYQTAECVENKAESEG